MSIRYTLEIYSEASLSPQSELVLESTIYLIGREKETLVKRENPSVNYIRVINPYISRVHCRLILLWKDADHDFPYYVIADGGINGDPSTNGTWLNGRKLDPKTLYELKNGNIISFGGSKNYPLIKFNVFDMKEKEHGTLGMEYSYVA